MNDKFKLKKEFFCFPLAFHNLIEVFWKFNQFNQKAVSLKLKEIIFHIF